METDAVTSGSPLAALDPSSQTPYRGRKGWAYCERAYMCLLLVFPWLPKFKKPIGEDNTGRSAGRGLTYPTNINPWFLI